MNIFTPDFPFMRKKIGCFIVKKRVKIFIGKNLTLNIFTPDFPFMRPKIGCFIVKKRVKLFKVKLTMNIDSLLKKCE